MKCFFCDANDIETIGERSGISNSYVCKRCGHVNMTVEAVEDFEGERFSQAQKSCLRIHNRIEFEGNKISVDKEGVHFDLSHRNRIEWEPDNLDGFRKNLENRIKAVIV